LLQYYENPIDYPPQRTSVGGRRILMEAFLLHQFFRISQSYLLLICSIS